MVLILPLGALFTAFVRTIIGIRTFGTFSPTLLALAFVYNDFRSGLCIFAVVLATGFISRGVLDRLKLLLGPAAEHHSHARRDAHGAGHRGHELLQRVPPAARPCFCRW